MTKQEAIMKSHYTNSHNRKAGGKEMVLAWVAVVAVCDPSRAMALGCGLLDRVGWAAFEMLRLALLMGHWPIASDVSEGSKVLEVLLQVGPWLCCLLHLAASRA
jgi:hypothetical protein